MSHGDGSFGNELRYQKNRPRGCACLCVWDNLRCNIYMLDGSHIAGFLEVDAGSADRAE